MNNPPKLGRVPLERALSKLGIASRSQTRLFIEQGFVEVDGKIIRDAQFMLVPETAKIKIKGKLVEKAKNQTIILYKPRGVVTTKSDEKNRKTIYDLLPSALHHLHPVGRLDMATTGLLILTTDTALSNYLTDPAHAIKRTYIVTVEGFMNDDAVNKLRNGIVDKGEVLKPYNVVLRKKSQKESHLTVTLTEGKNREIRRLMEAIGHPVTQLKRVSFGTVTLGDLSPGQFKVADKEILKEIKRSFNESA